jgi:hypothetical protein
VELKAPVRTEEYKGVVSSLGRPRAVSAAIVLHRGLLVYPIKELIHGNRADLVMDGDVRVVLRQVELKPLQDRNLVAEALCAPSFDQLQQVRHQVAS